MGADMPSSEEIVAELATDIKRVLGFSYVLKVCTTESDRANAAKEILRDHGGAEWLTTHVDKLYLAHQSICRESVVRDALTKIYKQDHEGKAAQMRVHSTALSDSFARA
jgi:hypothetical protein